MADRYLVKVGLSYPATAAVDEALRGFGRAVDLAETEDARAQAEQARAAAVQEAFESGAMKRAEVGDVVDDLPAQSIGWLLIQRAIELAPVITEAEWADLGRASDSPTEPTEPVAAGDVNAPRRRARKG